jgi:hypothetical protein
MSIKGKVKTIPPYYQTLGQSTMNFEDGTDTRPLVKVDNLLPFYGNTVESILQSTTSDSVILSPYTRFIPLFYLRHGESLPVFDSGRHPHIEEFYRVLARRELNQYMAGAGILDPDLQGKLHAHITGFGKAKREKWRNSVIGRIVSVYGAQTKSSGEIVIIDYIKRYLKLDLPLVFTQHSIGYQGAFSRDQMFSAFSEANPPSHFSQRTYGGVLDLLTLFYRSNLIRNSGDKLLPAVVAVVDPQTLVYQKLHWVLTGTFDLSRVSVLVDQELDSPKFPVNGLREFYYKNLQPWMINKGLNIWKVPRVFIEDYCLLKEEIPRAGGILKYKQRCDEFINKVYAEVSKLYTGPRDQQRTIQPAIIETPRVTEVPISEVSDFFEVAAPPVEAADPLAQTEGIFGDVPLSEAVIGAGAGWAADEEPRPPRRRRLDVDRSAPPRRRRISDDWPVANTFDEGEELEEAAAVEHPEISEDDWFARAQDMAEALATPVPETSQPVQPVFQAQATNTDAETPLDLIDEWLENGGGEENFPF